LIYGGNKVLSSTGHFWARSNQECDDCTLSFRLKVTKGSIHLVFRMNDQGRYFIRFDSKSSMLSKQYWPDTLQEDLDKKTVGHKLETWHQVEINVEGSEITFKVDNKSEWFYTDPDPLFSGDFSFETLDFSQAEIDDIKVQVTSPDVIRLFL